MAVRGWLALAAVALLAGCTSSTDSTLSNDAESGSPVALSATLTQSRVNEGTRLINAELTNTSDAPVTVASVTLDSSQFEPLPPVDKGSVFVPGATIDLAIDYGEPICDGDLKQASFTVTLGDGSTQELSIDPAGMEWLGRLYDRECALASIGDIASFSYGPTFTQTKVDGQLVLTGDLLVERPDDGDDTATLTIRGFGGSVLIRFEANPPDAVPLDLRPGVERLRIPIQLGAFRCDQHARGQSSQTFLLSIYVKPPDLDQQRVILVPDKALQNQILDLIDTVCGDTDF